jgi:6-phosphogluconolactonase (cycloisomerase 2 family)
MNYLIAGNRYYYASAGRMPGSKSKAGTVAVLGKIHMPHCDLGVLQSVSVEGITPCHLTLSCDENFLYTANYSSGDIFGEKSFKNTFLNDTHLQ